MSVFCFRWFVFVFYYTNVLKRLAWLFWILLRFSICLLNKLSCNLIFTTLDGGFYSFHRFCEWGSGSCRYSVSPERKQMCCPIFGCALLFSYHVILFVARFYSMTLRMELWKIRLQYATKQMRISTLRTIFTTCIQTQWPTKATCPWPQKTMTRSPCHSPFKLQADFSVTFPTPFQNVCDVG